MTDQLDLFADSRDVMLRNDALAALERRDAAAAARARDSLAAECGGDPALASIDTLIGALTAPLPARCDRAALRVAIERLETAIEPAARLFGDAAASARWVAPLWRDAARSAAHLPCEDDQHAAALWLRAGDWAAAAAAVETIESWRRIPQPLAWMAEARCRAHGAEAALVLLAELAWLAPRRFDAVAQRTADPRLERWLVRYDAEFETDAAGRAWFPAWLLTHDAKLAARLDTAQRGLDSAPEQAARTLLEILRLEHAGSHRAVVERRRALRALSEPLFAAYMTTR